ncbi:MAG TPA: di-heme oxidoredictase family protein [Steroidobacteraceae bacterium]
MVFSKRPAAVSAAVLIVSGFSTAFAQTDPGLRPGAINGQSNATATNPLPLASVLTPATGDPANAQAFFSDGLDRFQEVETITGNGLGPRFNFNQCSGCHSQPTIGGSGPATNPQFTAISKGIASGQDSMPSFITANGPTREARFPFFFNADGSANTNAPNGGVETIFTVSGMPGATSCSLTQPSFSAAAAAGNLIFRIPTPLFGAGLLENIDDSTLIAVEVAAASNGVGVRGTFNYNGNDGTIARFGWKAQNKSLLLFSGEAYNVEMGVANELFPQDRPLPGEEQLGNGLTSSCLNLEKVGYPEDITNFGAAGSGVLSDVEGFAQFMRLLAPPIASTTTPGGTTSISNGKSLFSSVGCAVCHTPSMKTQASHITSSLGNATVSAYSDLEIHHMGTGLADNVSQGGAGGDQFRTAPLWGLGQRIFFLHDGRTTNLLSAVTAHRSSGSEANTVIANFNSLSASQKQDVLNFLRSL